MLGMDDRAGVLGFGLRVEPSAPRCKFNRTLDLEKLQVAANAITANDPAWTSVGEQQKKRICEE